VRGAHDAPRRVHGFRRGLNGRDGSRDKEVSAILSIVENHTLTLSPRISEAGVADYIALLKPRVMSLVIFTALVGMVIAPGYFHPVLAFTSILCIAVGAGASGALNMWYDADIDALMSRTANRPIPAGRVTPQEALAFGLTLSFFSVMTLGILVNWVAGGLLAFTIFFYAVVYTMWLKRFTAQNIVIGGAAGALPPVVAWAAATGSLAVEPVLLFLIIFFWTPPHFWALALFRTDDYARANVPMLPVVAGPDATRLQILLYTVVLVAVAAAPWPMGYFDAAYGLSSLALGGGMLLLAIKVYRNRTGARALRAARQLFGFSILYLFALFAILLLEVVVKAAAPLLW
jgi:protoheme IX farnesyltransferase